MLSFLSRCSNLSNEHIHFLGFSLLGAVLAEGYSISDVYIGYQLTLAIPSAYTEGFSGRAYLMETEQISPNFRTALSVEAMNKKYSCSLDIFLGDVKVWSSGHLSQFYTTEKCVLELTHHGDLRLKDEKERIGWRSGTSGQSVERLHLLRTGNLVLADSLNLIKWQSFNFPTDIMMWGQRLSSSTRLTSFPINSSNLFYSFEIQYDKIALYLNFGIWKYSYWEFRPSMKKNITFVQLSSKGLELFTGEDQKIDQITSKGPEPLRFLAIGNNTGNLGLYHYSAEKGKFEESYEALNSSCDLPLAWRGILRGYVGGVELRCSSYGVLSPSSRAFKIRLMLPKKCVQICAWMTVLVLQHNIETQENAFCINLLGESSKLKEEAV